MILRRICAMVIIVIVITFFSFSLVHLAPGNAVEIKLQAEGIVATDEIIAAEKAKMGLDKPFVQQYFTWVLKAIHGNLGNSYTTGTPVISMLKVPLLKTMKLSLISFAATCFFSVMLGILSACTKNRLPDVSIRGFSFVLNSVPTFGLAILLLYVVCYKLQWISIVNNGDWEHLILPVATMSITQSGRYVRLIRAAILDEFGQEYVLGARARGIKESVVIFGHILKNALSTIITHFGGLLGSVLGGTTVIEKVFQLKGMGTTVLSAISSRDIPVIQAYVIIMALSFAIANLIVDISYTLLNPRVSITNA